MNIEINKDFKNSYKDDFWRGFSLREVACVFVGLATWAAVAMIARFGFSMQLNAAVFLGFPFAVPVFVFGFFRPQNRLTITQWIKEIRYTSRTKQAVFSSLEDPGIEGRSYCMAYELRFKKAHRLPYRAKRRGGKKQK